MAKRKEQQQDPLREKILAVVLLVENLRRETADLKNQLRTATQRINQLEADRGTVRQRVSRMLEIVRA